MRKGVEWKVGRVFFRDELAYRFDLLPENGHRRPAFVNLQQYYLEEFLVDRVAELPSAEVRWHNKVVGVTPDDDGAVLRVTTPEGEYWLSCDWLIVADGARSTVRTLLGLESEGQVFRDRFLIADIHMRSDFPAERWFWFDPPFHRNQSALLHRQADDVWRIDFQLGWDADPEEERKPERILPRLRAMLGPKVEFDIEWASVYTFQCRRMRRFRHGRVLFAGDAAHLVSPFGARGANSGIQDADNLVWKLALVIKAMRPRGCWRPTTPNGLRRPTRTSSIRRARPTSSRRRARCRAHSATRCWRSPSATPLRGKLVNSGRLSIPHVLCRIAAQHARRARRIVRVGARSRARPRPMRRCAAPGRSGCSTTCRAGLRLSRSAAPFPPPPRRRWRRTACRAASSR